MEMLLQKRQLVSTFAASCTPRITCRIVAPCSQTPTLPQSALRTRHVSSIHPVSTFIHKKNTTRDIRTHAIDGGQALGVALFFAPSVIAVIYAYFKGKGNVKDGLSRMLTEFSQGYFQPDVGGKNIPVAQGELSDLAGDEPLFKALYQW